MRIESKKTSYVLCYVCVYVRIVEVEEYLDAKSDDTLSMCERRKKDTLVVVFPSKQSLFWDAESHDGKKKEKTVGPKSPTKRETKILFSLHTLFLEKEILSLP